MPIEYEIDSARRLIIATPKGMVTFEDMAEYQKQVWGQAELAGYCELINMNGVTAIRDDTMDNIQKLVKLSGTTDRLIGRSKLAIVASSDFHYGMGRMYKVLRENHPGSTKEVEVFRKQDDALRWLFPRDTKEKISP